MASLLNEFTGITQALNKLGIDYAVCGGWAMAIHGFLRATIDIDLLVMAKDIDIAFEAARSQGFDIEGLPLNFDGGKFQLRRISKIDPESKELITLDLLLVTEYLEDVWADRQRVEWNRGEYKIVSREGMIKMKKMADRPKDRIDLDFLRGETDGN